jgi:hypothetical protein
VPFYWCSVLIHPSPVDATDSASKQNTFLCLSETRNYNTVWDLRSLQQWIGITGFWNVTPCSSEDRYQRVGL